MPLLVGTDGKQKMSKSLGNQIGITDAPNEMYGKAMSIPDEAVGEYRRLLLDDPSDGLAGQGGGATDEGGLPRAELGAGAGAGDDEGAGGGVESGASAGAAAREAKRALARDLVSWLHSPEDAAAAERHFDRVFVSLQAPEQIEQASFAAGEGSLYLPGLIAAEFGVSGSEARRLIDQGAVTLGETVVGRGQYDVASADADGQVLKVGKRRFRRLKAT
jgi:tyrosyl-tRNA synthetase